MQTLLLSLSSTIIAYIAGITLIYAIYTIWTGKAKPVIMVSLLFSVSAFFYSGYLSGINYEQEKVKQQIEVMTAKVQVAESAASAIAEQSKAKTVIVEKIIKEKGQTVIKYIDRTITDNSCLLSDPFIDAINEAAK